MLEKEPSVCEERNYNKLFRKFYEPATKYIYYKCGDFQQAEDIVQNVFIKLWKLCNTITYSKAKSYIYTACNNLFLNHVAHQKVKLKHQKTLTDNIDYESPDFIIEIDEFREKLKAAINTLSVKEREVFLLSRVEKKTYKEIAEITGLTVKAIERRMSIALRELRDILGKEIKV
ncbi:sigma-70 family RNA polymerase sigma factor [Flavivirga abyssicola]|uniref:RNA polymerase sigma factor n=1 Tax=Flavivirga abyssicola TaxID=3063533 RepID=UPI0026DEC7C4|nr:sigma-70 family RNA polymerase sigma factor [Flavivirga sp. MEBiC07777]WVK14176.1 sigma-70 family RNA polymerase sigma factor [Flavivirga sp. MEBiC07777]